ncbi:MAG: hypothetical protein OXU79_08885 [Gemmatimonadota bacterium]|nr:hypothetical protein [Gemmatimonadota bacterium]
MSTATLTSLAMLKVQVDQRQDYLDYLRPFILQALITHRPERVTDSIVRDLIRSDFGLEIPDRAVQVVLKRISRQFPLKKEFGIYRIDGELPDPRIGSKRAAALRHIDAVILGLLDYSKRTGKPIESRDDAVMAICAFLTQFDIPCLRAYLRGTAIPTIKGQFDPEIILVSRYVISLQRTNPNLFESFVVVLKGHMLANALLCPDLSNAPKTYKGVTFYLDTPLLVRQLGIEGEPRQAAVDHLLKLLLKLGASVATFSHSRDELESVISGAAQYIDSPHGRGAIVMESRRRGTTRSDLLLLVGQLDDKLRDAQIEVLDTPEYGMDFQIDEAAFETALDDEVSYRNPRAKENDINSVRSIYELRAGLSPKILERSKAALVTSNHAFSRAAFQYGQGHEAASSVSSVITDFSLANVAWLKAPLGAPGVPKGELLAFSYAALQPSADLLEKYMNEIDRLENQGRITPRDHQLLRSSESAQTELMNLTLGEEDALTELTITETLRRVTEEIKKEESEIYKVERAAHQETQEQLVEQRRIKDQLQHHVYWSCRRKSSLLAWFISTVISLLLLTGLAAGIGLQSANPIIGTVSWLASGFLIVLTLASLLFGTTVRRLHEVLTNRCLTWFIDRQSDKSGVDFSEMQ